MTVTLRPLTSADVAAHNAGEDDATVTWLNGRPSTYDSTRAHFRLLAANKAAGRGKRGFGVWLDGRLAGYIDFDPDNVDGLSAGDVNICFAVHPWARRRGVAVSSVRLLCAYLSDAGMGAAAAMRIAPANIASVRVAERSGFTLIRQFTSQTDIDAAGKPITMRLYRRTL